MKYLIIDIDHTLSHAHWRDEMIEIAYRDKSWDDYHSKSAEDKPVEELAELVCTCWRDNWVTVALTTRPEKWRTMTNAWLLKHGIKIDTLLMRPDDDFRSNADSKLAIFQQWREQLGSVVVDHLVFIDDHDGIVTAFKGINITVLQAHIRRDG